MKILVINTAFIEADLAVSSGSEEFIKMNSECKHSENLLVNLESILEKTHTKLNELDAISVVIGPGSFTGIRISVATVKAMAMVHPQINLIPINSLELLAFSYFKSESSQETVNTIIDALSGNFYFAKYDRNLNEIIPPCLIKEDDIKNISGAVASIEKIKDVNSKIVELSPNELLELSKKFCEEKRFVPENELLPMYLRSSQAEENLNNKRIKR